MYERKLGQEQYHLVDHQEVGEELEHPARDLEDALETVDLEDDCDLDDDAAEASCPSTWLRKRLLT